MTREPVIYIVDDDSAIRDSLSDSLHVNGYVTRCFEDAKSFLSQYDIEQPGCALLDYRLPDLNGLEIHHQMQKRGGKTPIVLMTAYAEVPMSVRAMKQGAVDFLEKPFAADHMREAVAHAIQLDREQRERDRIQNEAIERLRDLSPRERQVLDGLTDGLTTKEIAKQFGSSFHTVQNQRASVMRRTKAASFAELFRLSLQARGIPVPEAYVPPELDLPEFDTPPEGESLEANGAASADEPTA